MSFTYDGNGLLIDVEDSSTGHYTFAYETIDNQSYIQSVTDFANRTVLYTHYKTGDNDFANGNPGDLKLVRSPVIIGEPDKTVTYTYSKDAINPLLAGNLLTIKDARGHTYLKNTYAATRNVQDLNFDRLMKQQWGDEGQEIHLTYATIPANQQSSLNGASSRRSSTTAKATSKSFSTTSKTKV